MQCARWLVGALATIGILVVNQPARGGFITFESLDVTFNGGLTSLSVSEDGVTAVFSRTSGGRFDIVNPNGVAVGWGSRSLTRFELRLSDAFNVNFSSEVSNISLQFADFGADHDTPVTLQAYSGENGSGSLLAADSETWQSSDSFPDFKSLTVNATGVRSIRISSGGPLPNSVYWDNLSFNSDMNAVPVPGSLAMLVLGMAAMAGGYLVRRRQTA